MIRETRPYSVFAYFYGVDGLLASWEIYDKDNNQTWYNKQRFRYQYVPGTDLLAESRVLNPYLDHSIPVAHLAPGIYYLRVTSKDNNTQVKPLIIQH